VRGTPVIVVWQYEKSGAKKISCLLRVARLHAAGTIARAAHDFDPKAIAVAKPAGLMPHDPVFRFDEQQCIRTPEHAYTKDGGLSILYGDLARKARS